MTSPGVVLALGGGGARGLAHLGVIEALEEAGIPIERIVGVSMGSISGALYAVGRDVHDAQHRVEAYVDSEPFRRHQDALFGARRTGDPRGAFEWLRRMKDYWRANFLFHRVILTRSLLPDAVLRRAMESLLPDIDVAETRCPLTIVAMDLITGGRRRIESGPLRQAAHGSSALPAVFAPVPFEDALLCDVGVVDPVPSALARSISPMPVVAVDVGTDLRRIDSCDTALEVVLRMEEATSRLFRDVAGLTAEVTIAPALADLEWLDFRTIDAVFAAGRDAGQRAVPEIQRTLAAWRDGGVSLPRTGRRAGTDTNATGWYGPSHDRGPLADTARPGGSES